MGKCNSSVINVVVEQREEKLRIAAGYLPHFFTLHVQKARKTSYSSSTISDKVFN